MYGCNFIEGSLFGSGSEQMYKDDHQSIQQPEYFDIVIDNDSQINCKEGGGGIDRSNSFSLEPNVDISKL